MLFFTILLLILFVLRLWLSGFTGIHPDEAYYWVWSLDLKLGYLDHPPMIAWIIAAGRWIIETISPNYLQLEYPAFFSVVKLKAGPFFLSCVATPVLVGKCIEWVQRAPLRVTQMIVLLVTPLLFVGPQIVTPDTPLFFSWTLCLLMAIRLQKRRYYKNDTGDLSPPLWSIAVTLGIAMAFAAYSKYTAVLLAFLVLISGAGLWNAMICALVCSVLIAPYVYWLATTGVAEEAGIFFQFGNAIGDVLKPNNFKFVGDLWASQILFWTPMIFLGVFGFLFTDVRRFFLSDKKHRLSGTLFIWAIAPLVLFSLTALKRPAEANWPLVGGIAAIVMCVARLRLRMFSLTLLTIQNVAIISVAWLVLTQAPKLSVFFEDISPRASALLEKPSRLREFEGWPRLHTLLKDAVLNEDSPIVVESFQILSSLLFVNSSLEEENKLKLYFWEEGSRRSEFNRTPKYLLAKEELNKGHWLLTRDQKNVPDCRLYQGLIKSVSEVYFLYTCKGLRP